MKSFRLVTEQLWNVKTAITSIIGATVNKDIDAEGVCDLHANYKIFRGL